MIILGVIWKSDLSRVIRKDIEAGQGGSELEMNEVYSLIAYSMS